MLFMRLIFPIKQCKILAVECKNYGEDRIVGIKELKIFKARHITYLR